MKNTLIIIFFLIAFQAEAQVIGARGGVNIAEVHYQEADYQTRLGMYAGLMMKFELSENIAIRPELLYSIKGYYRPETANTSEVRVGLAYLNFPLLLEFQVKENLSVSFGPEFGYLLHANSRFDRQNHDVSQNFQKTDLGLDIGLSHRISKKLGADLRYNFGFKGLHKGVITDQYGNIIGEGKTGANRVLQLGLDYFLKK